MSASALVLAFSFPPTDLTPVLRRLAMAFAARRALCQPLSRARRVRVPLAVTPTAHGERGGGNALADLAKRAAMRGAGLVAELSSSCMRHPFPLIRVEQV